MKSELLQVLSWHPVCGTVIQTYLFPLILGFKNYDDAMIAHVSNM